MEPARYLGLFAAIALAVPACGGSSDSGGGSGGAGTGGNDAGVTGGSGGTGGIGGGTAGQGGAGGTTTGFPCKDPKPVLVDGKETGLVTCGTSTIARQEAKTCPTTLPRADTCTADQTDCTQDSDCSAQANGYCKFTPGGGGAPSTCGCAYGCTEDSDCGTGMRCLCGDPVGTCVAADCGSSADCGNGYECVTSIAYCATPQLHCQGPADECGSSDDCDLGMYCTVGSQGNLVCQSAGCGARGG
ncbi:MAG: hypothetical protein KC776_09730 [Myxococcales bacterium]|nr:hypothetical protein [Myxococcales bacterium]